MKYLKLFESFQENEYFTEVSSEEYYNFFEDENNDRNTLDLSQNDLSKIKTIFSENQVDISKKKTEPRYRGGRSHIFLDITSKLDKFTIFIKVLDDEWYGVYFCDAGRFDGDITDSTAYNEWYESHERYFKCDQWDGLIECLKYLAKNF